MRRMIGNKSELDYTSNSAQGVTVSGITAMTINIFVNRKYNGYIYSIENFKRACMISNNNA